MLDLIQELEAIIPIPDDGKLRLMRHLNEEKLEKNDYLVKAGDICRKIYFIRVGMIYGFYKYRGEYITTRFAKSKEICFVPESFILQTPSKENLTAVYPSVVYSLSNAALQDLCKYMPQFSKLTEHYFLKDYIEVTKCLHMFRSRVGFDRYKWLKENRPDLLVDLPMNKNSSYIGVSSTTLGRFIKQDTGKCRGLYRRVNP